MKNYEVTFIVDPVLSGDEIKATAQTYVEQLKSEGCSIVHKDEMGLRQLAYPINKRTSGVYYSVEFTSENGTIIPKVELALRRDERIMRFLTIKLDKYGVKYNEDKRNGLIGKRKTEEEDSKDSKSNSRDRRGNDRGNARAAKPAPTPKPKPVEKPKAEAKAEEE